MSSKFKLALGAGLTGLTFAVALSLSRSMDGSSAIGVLFWICIAVAVFAGWVAVISME